MAKYIFYALSNAPDKIQDFNNALFDSEDEAMDTLQDATWSPLDFKYHKYGNRSAMDVSIDYSPFFSGLGKEIIGYLFPEVD
jgi:hypothetical protein